MLELASQMKEAAAAVQARWSEQPVAGIILGTGLGRLADEIADSVAIPYADVPHFPQSTAIGHAGQLVCGQLAGRPVVAFQGRFHLYEGNSAQQAAMPVRLLQAMNVPAMIVSNAAGGLNPHYRVGDLMMIEDQINLQFDNPLIGVNDDNLGPRFPDMSAPYDIELQTQAAQIAQQADIELHRGVYVSVLGPNYETRAEYRMARQLGGDAVGMSTTPETTAARHAGMRVLGFSTITNVGSPDILSETDGHDVIAAADAASGKLRTIVEGVVSSF
ncbi:purine-nucleoside phosphorylase [Adhaeretor mobilis]|uniref:Purine nucleoside phosphorylase n=1 Tax=Adhaeretor mobilis TaxID=1930276 RepID=A0A517MUN9_9BACT|nr:purine-nucleoside phosphorylase [Adhaeretor mobilis]QDS98605.1 Purine nucleoside phosphorylase 1 [Adhaeretor mobilis]